MIDHTGIHVGDLARSVRFYERALAPLDYEVCLRLPTAVGFGVRGGPRGTLDPGGEFWVSAGPRYVPRTHIAFGAPGEAAVRAFHLAALAAGGKDQGRPGLRRRHDHAQQYAALVLDPDGYTIEAVWCPPVIIFDLDNLLADTERLHCAAYREVLAEIGVQLDEGEYAEHWIQKGLGIVEYCQKHALAHDPRLLRQRKAHRYQALVASSARPMPGALELLNALHGRRQLALATSSFADAAHCVLTQLGIGHYFKTVATGTDVQRAKPYPDLLLHVSRTLGVAPSDCVVLDDAEKGILAASAAGMAAIGVPSPATLTNDFSQADLVVSSLREISLEILDELCAKKRRGAGLPP